MIKSLYIHIPFCKQICTYCDFAKLVGNPSLMLEYTEALIKELDYYSQDLTNIETIHIGGGTPSALPIELLQKLLIKLSHLFNLKSLKEFGMEANPNDISEELVMLLKKYHVTRLSLGVESSNPLHLKAMNRSHTIHQVEEAVSLLHRHGFHNINLDFIYAWPQQTMEELKRDLRYALSLKPTHLSFYALILEPKTKLYHDYINHEVALIDEDTDASMYEYLLDELPKNGYNHYEISNFALKGYESKHNLAYWNLDEYLGIGMGAHSQVDTKRFHNSTHIKEYLLNVENNHCGIESYDACDLIQETFLMGLRKVEGVNLTAVSNRFLINPLMLYPKILKNIEDHLLVVENDYLKLTQKGMLLLNYVERSFI
ncbi:MAG: coproporphyrinogen III oxidase [Tenericutes bacterium HGW-Tenericutes-1]|jgi:oxygen-independent coproporphyrinogen-3 oxidase|nr:MAG: coproporphyrinogen III oxidase [Tenericutes bacterium HGW-Tenericutes-1]